MKRLLLIGLCFVGFTVDAMQQQVDRLAVSRQQLHERLLASDVELAGDAAAAATAVVIEQLPATPDRHQAGSVSADNSPDRDGAVEQMDMRTFFSKAIEYLKKNPQHAQELRDSLDAEMASAGIDADLRPSRWSRFWTPNKLKAFGCSVGAIGVFVTTILTKTHTFTPVLQAVLGEAINLSVRVNPIIKLKASLAIFLIMMGVEYYWLQPTYDFILGVCHTAGFAFIGAGVELFIKSKPTPVSVENQHTTWRNRLSRWFCSLKTQE